MIFRKRHVGFTHDILPSPEDGRDLLTSNLMPKINLPDRMTPLFDLVVSNQGNSSSCVGHSCATLKQNAELLEKEFVIFNGEWIYDRCKEIDGLYNFRGTYLRVGMDILHKLGAMPINGGDPSKYRIAKYARVDDLTPNGLKTAIRLYGAVIAGFTGSNEGWGRVRIRPPQGNEHTWGHAVTLIGYNENNFIGQNSWGETAHNKGLFECPISYMPFEAWVRLVDKENISRDSVKTAWIAKRFLDVNNKVKANVLNVRSGPGLKHEVVDQLKIGDIVKLYGSPNVPADGFWWAQIII